MKKRLAYINTNVEYGHGVVTYSTCSEPVKSSVKRYIEREIIDGANYVLHHICLIPPKWFKSKYTSLASLNHHTGAFR
ncbi:hypothetical protein YC2023_069159 [Brassica napus]